MKSLMAMLVLGSLFITGCASKKTMDHAKMEATSHSKLDDLIRGEMAAVETYTQVMEKVKDKPEIAKLSSMRDSHKSAIEKLQAHANQPVMQDAQNSGAWGTFAKVWTGGAKIFGDKAAIRALKQGEEHGASEYEELLKDEKVSAHLKEIVRTELLPNQKKRISALEKYL